MSDKLDQPEQFDQPVKWTIALRDLSDQPVKKEISLSESQRQQLASLTELEKINDFAATLSLKAINKGRFELKGKISSVYQQKSAISLKSLPIVMDETFVTEFWPEDQNDPVKSPELDLDYADEMVEFFKGEKLDIGQVIYEQFVVAIEQFPREEGENFTFEASTQEEERQDNPFAVLKTLKEH